ncbi:MAG: hypothetical protein EB117_15020 [Betaproteobacteria bacterium]|nr:hypothetical protein [Betaproteobacteria bacterium]
MSFDKAKEAIQSAGFSLNRAVLSQSYIRSEVLLSTTATRYRFPLLVNDNFSTVTNTSNLLNLQDAFYISHAALFFAKPSSSTDTTFQLVTYPNSIIFSTANTAASLYTWYNAYFTLTVNNRVIWPQLDAYRFYDVPQTQDGSAAAVIDQQKGSDSALYPIEPGVVLVGSKQNVLECILPATMTAVESNSRAILYLAGHLAQNVTPVN